MNATTVFLQVPQSTTFLNAIIVCDVQDASATRIICLTRPHLAADADADDPDAQNVQPAESTLSDVIVLICDPAWTTDILRQYCWDDPTSPRATCAAGANCTVAYKSASTPAIKRVSPSSGAANTTLRVSGSGMDNVTAVQMLDASGKVADTCTIITASRNASMLSCNTPDLPAGAYTIRLRKSNGECRSSCWQGSAPLPARMLCHVHARMLGQMLWLFCTPACLQVSSPWTPSTER